MRTIVARATVYTCVHMRACVGCVRTLSGVYVHWQFGGGVRTLSAVYVHPVRVEQMFYVAGVYVHRLVASVLQYCDSRLLVLVLLGSSTSTSGGVLEGEHFEADSVLSVDVAVGPFERGGFRVSVHERLRNLATASVVNGDNIGHLRVHVGENLREGHSLGLPLARSTIDLYVRRLPDPRRRVKALCGQS